MWLEELKDDKEETLQAVFVFRDPIIDSVKHIHSNLYASANQITDGFPPCQVIGVIHLFRKFNAHFCDLQALGLFYIPIYYCKNM